MEFEEGNLVLLKVSPWKGLTRFGKKGKLSPRYVGPFEILKRVGIVAYELALPPHMEHIHNVFHVSMLKKYNPDSRHVIEYEPIEFQAVLSYVESLIEILEEREKVLRNKVIGGRKFSGAFTNFNSNRVCDIRGDMAFGFAYNDFYAGSVADPQDRDYSLTISATPLPHKGSLRGKHFMLPSVHLDTKFLHDLNSSRCPNVAVKVYVYFSDYMVALDGGKVFCVVSYGSGSVPKDDWRGVDPYTSYVTLLF
ncbi:hypothetical protein AgCh_006052 [Apium graveolens]